ncbi:MAG: hypothetical protein E7176_05315 [Erysipelotrichaceae bacterium]|nr:hypothetical protein [Erysipelotrichaceae bacterium]
MDFFDIISDNFFSLLSSKNKRIYLASILQAFKVYENGSILGIDKKVVVDDLVYFLDTNSYLYDVEDEEDEEANPKSKRELANYILRRMEECGWIYVDVTNDYEEILNFTDAAIIICEAILKAYPQFDANDDFSSEFINPNEYQGYIYSIYSLLNQSDNVEYALIFSLVYSNTKQLIRAIRRLDARMKDYIQSVIDNSEIKDLMEKLILYKTDVYDSSYVKLKVSDNINRYRLGIITRLKEMQNDDVIVKAIANNYIMTSRTIEEAESKAVRYIDEVIDAFNAIEEFISEIDNKNRNYVNSTIGKIKFLLSEEDNVIGKINTILKYVKDSNKNGKIDKALKLVDSLHALRVQKALSNNSLYTPRGSYTRTYSQILDDVGLDSFEMTPEFLEQFKSSYNEDYIASFMDTYMIDNFMRASQIIDYNCGDDLVIMLVYCVIYAVDKNHIVELCDNIIDHKKFRLRDFIIKRRV